MLTTKRWDAGSLAGPGEEMYRWIERLYPLCRSITGPGVEETLAMLQEQVPLRIERVPSETQAFDWTVPHEWTIRDAYVKDSSGRRVIDFRASNLHVLSYSRPVLKQVSLAESLSMCSRIAGRSSSLATSRPTDMTSASIAPLASISRSVPSLVPLNGQYPQYHTSADDLTFVAPACLAESLNLYLKVTGALEVNGSFVNQYPFCEPQLGQRGLYDQAGGRTDPDAFRMARLWVLNQSDGRHALLDIAERSQIGIEVVADAAAVLCRSGVMRRAAHEPSVPATIGVANL